MTPRPEGPQHQLALLHATIPPARPAPEAPVACYWAIPGATDCCSQRMVELRLETLPILQVTGTCRRPGFRKMTAWHDAPALKAHDTCSS